MRRAAEAPGASCEALPDRSAHTPLSPASKKALGYPLALCKGLVCVIRCNAECQYCPQRPRPVQGNVLRSTKGIQMLPHLEELDLRCNLIASIHEVVRLSGNSSVLLQRQLHDAITGTQHIDIHFSQAPIGALETCAFACRHGSSEAAVAG